MACRPPSIDALPGVGPARKAALLRHFKTLRAIREADVAAVSEIVPRTVAETIYAHYHPKPPTAPRNEPTTGNPINEPATTDPANNKKLHRTQGSPERGAVTASP